MDSGPVSLTLAGVFGSWRWDTSGVATCAVIACGYLWACRRARARGVEVQPGRALCLLSVGVGLWLLTAVSMIGVYSDTLFWVRALQVLLLLYVVPFGLAAGAPITVVGSAIGATGRTWPATILNSRMLRIMTYPLTGSALLLVTPWVLFLSPWLAGVVHHAWLDALTRLLLPAIGFVYFYSRLQVDPVPRQFPQSVSLLITAIESLADGVLGLVLWLGPLVAHGYFAAIQRNWGPSPRTDQVIGAGVFWILGDVLGLPFLLTLMRTFSADERRRSAEIDAELDARAEIPRISDAADTVTDASMMPGLWWEDDPQLRERFQRRTRQ